MPDKRIIDYNEAESFESDDYLIVDGTTNGTRKIKPNQLQVGTDKTLSIENSPADAKAVGDELSDVKADLNEINDSVVLDIKGGEKQVDFTPTIRQFVIYDATGKITTDSKCRSMYFECKPSMKYRIDKIAGTRFTVGFTSSLPEDNVVCSNWFVNRTASEIEIDSQADSLYMIVFYWYSVTDTTITADEVLASITIKELHDGIVPKVDPTLRTKGNAADANITGTAIRNINGGELNVDFTPNVNNWYLDKIQMKIKADANAKTFYFKCESNTKYIIRKRAGTRFGVGCTATLPTAETTLLKITNDYTADEIVLETPSDAKYLCVYYWFNTDSISADEMLATIVITEDYGVSLEETKERVSELYDFGEISVQKTKEAVYLSSANGKVISDANASAFYFACEPNTEYKINRIAGTRFVVGCFDTIPVVDTVATNWKANNSGDSITIKTADTSTYVLVYYWFKGSDSITEPEAYSAITVNTVILLGGSDVRSDIKTLKSTVNNLRVQKQTIIYAGCILDATSQDNRFAAMSQLMNAAKAQELDPDGDYSNMLTYASCGAVCRLPIYNTEMFTGYDFEILVEKNAEQQCVPASITKVMSLITGLDYAENLADRITIVTADLAGGSGSTFYNGDILTLEDILSAMMVESSNTCSNAFSRYCGAKMLGINDPTTAGCKTEFIRRMNLKASEIGMTNSYFDEPHGMSWTCRSTAHDMMLVLINACRFPWILRAWRYTGGRTIHVYGDNDRDITMTGRTPTAIGNDFFIHGGKTGGMSGGPDGATAASLITIASPMDS